MERLKARLSFKSINGNAKLPSCWAQFANLMP